MLATELFCLVKYINSVNTAFTFIYITPKKKLNCVTSILMLKVII